MCRQKEKNAQKKKYKPHWNRKRTAKNHAKIPTAAPHKDNQNAHMNIVPRMEQCEDPFKGQGLPIWLTGQAQKPEDHRSSNFKALNGRFWYYNDLSLIKIYENCWISKWLRICKNHCLHLGACLSRLTFGHSFYLICVRLAGFSSAKILKWSVLSHMAKTTPLADKRTKKNW